MGITATTNGVTTTTVNKDTDGNVKYNTDKIILPYVTQGQWSSPNNYSFLDSRYDSKYAPVSGGGYLDKTSFDSVLTKSTPYSSLKTGYDGLSTKYSSMQNTYNTNFSTIANNLGLTTTDGVVSGTLDSSTFVTQTSLNDTLSKINSTKTFPAYTLGTPNNAITITLKVIKSGNNITYIGSCKVYPDYTLMTINLKTIMGSDTNYLSGTSINIIVQDLDLCGSTLQVSSDTNTVMCQHKPYYTRTYDAGSNDQYDGRWSFVLARPGNFAGGGDNISYINFVAYGTKA